ncbi:hypothetical protein J6590_099491 [Homalodisca vitripennis]|nr:hypothetical protein J6590_099491 [Homalodisca vitripennis]
MVLCVNVIKSLSRAECGNQGSFTIKCVKAEAIRPSVPYAAYIVCIHQVHSHLSDRDPHTTPHSIPGIVAVSGSTEYHLPVPVQLKATYFRIKSLSYRYNGSPRMLGACEQCSMSVFYAQHP